MRPPAERLDGVRRTRCARALLRFVLGALLVMPQLAGRAVEAGERHALLIGLNEYQNAHEGISKLKFAVDDVDALEEALQGRGFIVTSLTNRRAEREDILIELYRYAEELEPDDTFVLFFAGHGVRNTGVNDRGYWLTFDARLGLLDHAGIRLEHLLDYVRDLKATQKLVLLDHCFAGDIVTAARSTGIDVTADGSGGASRDVDTSLTLARGMLTTEAIGKQIEGRSGGLVIVAAASGAALESNEVKHGLFTEALLRALGSRKASGDEVLEVAELVSFLKSEVDSLAQAHHFTQEVRTFTESGEVPTWVLASSMPVDSADSVRARVGELKRVLTRWNLNDWITDDTKFDLVEVLDRLLAAATGGPPLTDMDTKVVAEVEEHVRGTRPEKVRAESLQLVVDELRGAHQ